jgi:hypothetical protein
MLTLKALGGMALHDLTLFNQAILAKQGCHSLVVPNYLCARLLMGRYFSDSNYWHAPTKVNLTFGTFQTKVNLLWLAVAA